MNNRLQEMRLKSKLTKKVVAQVLNMTPEGYGYYEKGTRSPSIEVIKVLAEYYGVTTDYLLGVGDASTRDYLTNNAGMKSLKDLRAAIGVTQMELANSMGVSRSTVAMWETGGSQPDNDMLVKLADFFDVTTDFLLGVEKSPTRDYFTNSDDEFAFLDNMTADEIAEQCFQDFKILFSRSNKSNHEQMKGFYIDTYKRFNR